MDELKIKNIDAAIVQASKKIKVLNALSWPAGAEEKFLYEWRKGNARLPKIVLPVPDLRSNVDQLTSLAKLCDQTDPVEKFLAETAESYSNAGQMLMAIGTPEFTRFSTRLYGRPDFKYKNQAVTAIDAAQFMLEVTDQLLTNQNLVPPSFHINATDFSGWLKSEVDEFFDHDAVEVVLDPGISSKALAGATRIRVRSSAMFSQLDKDQLLFHEAFVHTATQLNGRKQSNLQCLGLGAPRTTRTQEGIAVFAELVTNAMDIVRLRRIALRVIAIQMALDGADFVDLFNYFLNAGQTPEESVRSAQRIFRGGEVKSGIVFTKDAMYLLGLLEVHTFLRLAIRDNRPELVRHIFAGRMTLADALRLSPHFETGWLLPPTYMPTWAADLPRLAAMMAYSAFVPKIKLENVYLERMIELEDELKHTHEAETMSRSGEAFTA